MCCSGCFIQTQLLHSVICTFLPSPGFQRIFFHFAVVLPQCLHDIHSVGALTLQTRFLARALQGFLIPVAQIVSLAYLVRSPLPHYSTKCDGQLRAVLFKRKKVHRALKNEVVCIVCC